LKVNCRTLSSGAFMIEAELNAGIQPEIKASTTCSRIEIANAHHRLNWRSVDPLGASASLIGPRDHPLAGDDGTPSSWSSSF